MHFYQNVFCTVNRDPFFNNLISESITGLEKIGNLRVLSDVEGLEWFSVSNEGAVNTECECGTAWQRVFLLQNLDEALYLNLLALQQKPCLIVCPLPKSAFWFCDKNVLWFFFSPLGMEEKVWYYIALSISVIFQMYFL